MIKTSIGHCVSIVSFSENWSSMKNIRLTGNHTQPTLTYSAQRECGERRGRVASCFPRPHRKFPTPQQREHPGCGSPPLLRCALTRWLWSLIPSRLGMQSLCPYFLTLSALPGSLQSALQIIMPHRCMAMDSLLTVCKDLWRTQYSMNAKRSLYYSTPLGVFSFVLYKHWAFTSGILNFICFFSPSPGYWNWLLSSSAHPTPCSSPGHGEFGSVKALYHHQLFLLIKDNIGLGTKACQKMLPFAFPEWTTCS